MLAWLSKRSPCCLEVGVQGDATAISGLSGTLYLGL